MKKLVTILCCWGILAGSIAFSLSLCSKTFVSDALVEAAISKINIEESLNSVLISSELNTTPQTAEKLMKISNGVANDKEVREALREFVEIAVNDIVTNEVSTNNTKLPKAIKTKVLSYAQELSDATNGVISKEEVTSKMNEVLENNNLGSYYEDMMNLSQDSFSNSDKDIFSALNGLQGSTLFFGSLAIIIISSGVVFVLYKERLKALIPLGVSYAICSVLTFLILFIFGALMNNVMQTYAVDKSTGVNLSSLQITAVVYLVLAIGCFVGRAVYNRKISN